MPSCTRIAKKKSDYGLKVKKFSAARGLGGSNQFGQMGERRIRKAQ